MDKRVTGVGGIFFQAQNPKQLLAWYNKHLHIRPLDNSPWGADDDAPLFQWRDKDNPDQINNTVFAIYEENSAEMKPGNAAFILNFRVADLDGLLAALAAEGVQQQGDIVSYPFGRFARILDPEGNLIELWEPTEGF